MLKALLTALAIFAPATAMAQDIAIPMDRMGFDSVISVQTSSSQILTHRMLGRAGPGTYYYETYVGPGTDGPPDWVITTDGRGNLIERVDSAGHITSWSPHRCNRTLGTCSYIEYRPDGTQQSFYRQTQAVDGGFVYQVTNAAGVVTLSGRAILNEMGWTQWGSSQALNAAPVSVEILSAHFR